MVLLVGHPIKNFPNIVVLAIKIRRVKRLYVACDIIMKILSGPLQDYIGHTMKVLDYLAKRNNYGLQEFSDENNGKKEKEKKRREIQN